MFHILVWDCLFVSLSRCLSGRFNYEGLVPHKQYFAGTLLGMSSCASYVSRTHDVIDDVTRSQNRSNFESGISPSIFELERRSKGQNVGNAHGYLSGLFEYNYLLHCDGIDNVTLRLWKFSDFCSRHTVGVAGDDIMFHILVWVICVSRLKLLGVHMSLQQQMIQWQIASNDSGWNICKCKIEHRQIGSATMVLIGCTISISLVCTIIYNVRGFLNKSWLWIKLPLHICIHAVLLEWHF